VLTQTGIDMTIKEKLQADMDAAKAQVASLEQQIANLPSEIETLAVEAWYKVRDFFKAI